jgi:hypothetical protein
MEWILLVVGVWQIIFSFINKTKNVKSSIVYRVIPFYSGMFCIFYVLMIRGMIIPC